MSVGIQVWSQTASQNSTIDTNINWPEGMAPSQVNDSARALMASAAKWRDDNNGTIVTGGTTVAFTATTSQVEAALTAGYTIAIQFNATADTSATLAVDGLAAKPLQIVSGTNLQGGEFTAGDICRFTYSSSGTGQWIANTGTYVASSSNLAASAVTYAKIQNVAASRLLGNPTGGSAAPSEISLGTNLSFSGTTLNAGNLTPVVTVITSTSVATWQSTTQNGNFPLYLHVRMVGGGGGGGANNTNAGTAGTTTIFGGWSAFPGSGGAQGGGSGATGGSGGTGGATGTGTLITRVAGGSGNGEGNIGTGNALGGGMGGGSFYGGAGGGGGFSGGQAAAANSGSGGGGAGLTNVSQGGAGGGAGEYVEFIVTSPSTAYTTQVGAAGSGGSAGGSAGGNGAQGRIEVIAYWQ